MLTLLLQLLWTLSVTHTLLEVILPLVAEAVKNLPAMQETRVQSLCREDSLEKGMVTQSSILPGESYGQRGLEGYSPWGCKERNMIEVTYHARMMTDLRVFKSQVHSWA